jgi:hypothetical protein
VTVRTSRRGSGSGLSSPVAHGEFALTVRHARSPHHETPAVFGPGGSGERDEEEYARNLRDYVPRKVNRLKPGGYGPGAVRTRAGGSGRGT